MTGHCTPTGFRCPISHGDKFGGFMTDERKVALVTGSALNIGRAIALALARDGSAS
jgi:hypothetical protein